MSAWKRLTFWVITLWEPKYVTIKPSAALASRTSFDYFMEFWTLDWKPPFSLLGNMNFPLKLCFFSARTEPASHLFRSSSFFFVAHAILWSSTVLAHLWKVGHLETLTKLTWYLQNSRSRFNISALSVPLHQPLMARLPHAHTPWSVDMQARTDPLSHWLNLKHLSPYCDKRTRTIKYTGYQHKGFAISDFFLTVTTTVGEQRRDLKY